MTSSARARSAPSYPTEGGSPADRQRARVASNGWPRAGSSFVGRDDELAALSALLAGDRLITLTGAPGVGKTRLARELSDHQPDPAVFVDLARVGEPELVARALAVAVSAQEVPGRSLVASVVARVRRRALLLVLDNCEHLIVACRELVALLLDGCPKLTVLTTSREALNAEAERIWPVSPLPVPAPGETALSTNPAVCLFAERAGVVEPGFALNAYVGPAVAEICRRLDGIPLALELAAARVDVLTPAEIARRLDDRFDLLAYGVGGDLRRHETLEAALEWSYGLLSESEQALLRRVSVFVGGLTLEAAEAVCAGGPVASSDVHDLLPGLVSKSLLVREATGTGEARYRLLETIGAYASDRLERAGEAGTFRERHAAFYLELAEALEPELTGPQQERAFARLDCERENLRRAVEWSLGHAHGAWALRLAGSLVVFWRVRCHFSEGRELLESVLAGTGDDADPSLRARALWGAGFMTLMLGDPRGAADPLERSLSVFRDLGDPKGTARSLLILGNCNQPHRRATVLPMLEESATLARQVGDSWCLAHALAIAGFEHDAHGELTTARTLLQEAVGVARDEQDDQGLRLGLIGLGSVALQQGDYPLAQAMLEEGRDVADKLDEDYSKAEALRHLGWLALDCGDYAGAQVLLDQASALMREVGSPEVVLPIAMLRARLAHAVGDRTGAHGYFDEVMAQAGDSPPLLALEWMADLAADEGNFDEARRLLEAAVEPARHNGARALLAEALYGLGRVVGATGDARRAAALHHEALDVHRQIGAVPGVVASIEAVARVDPAAGGYHHSARLLGAAAALREHRGFARHPWDTGGYEADLAMIRQALGCEAFDVAYAAGAELSIDAAVEEALRRGRRRGRPANGWPALTQTEQQVAALAADSLTNQEIAEQLYLSLATVKRHMSHIFLKLGLTDRRQLRAVSRRGHGVGNGHER